MLWDFPFGAAAVNLAVYSPSGMPAGTVTTHSQSFAVPAAFGLPARLNVLACEVPWNSVTLTVSAYLDVSADNCAVAPPKILKAYQGQDPIGVRYRDRETFAVLLPSSATAILKS